MILKVWFSKRSTAVLFWSMFPVGRQRTLKARHVSALSSWSILMKILDRVLSNGECMARMYVCMCFTQVVWKSTTTLGCGYASCGASFIIPGGVFVVCRYSPAGNYLGEFAQNVFPPVNHPITTPAPCALPDALFGSSSATQALGLPSTTPAPSAFPVKVRMNAVVHGYTKTNFVPSIFLLALAKTLKVFILRQSKRVHSFTAHLQFVGLL